MTDDTWCRNKLVGPGHAYAGAVIAADGSLLGSATAGDIPPGAGLPAAGEDVAAVFSGVHAFVADGSKYAELRRFRTERDIFVVTAVRSTGGGGATLARTPQGTIVLGLFSTDKPFDDALPDVIAGAEELAVAE